MIEIKGKYNTAKVFTDIVDEASIAQIMQLCNQPLAEGERIRMMPDVHAGSGCTVGTTMTLRSGKVIPNLVGVDIGCGMDTVRLREREMDLAKLDALIYRAIPSGFSIREEPLRIAEKIDLTELHCHKEVDLWRGMQSIGTLGGGNHFIEVDRGDDGALYLVIHSGSRRLGLEVAKYYQNQAYHQCNRSGTEETQALVARLKADGRHKEIGKAVTQLQNTKRTPLPRDLTYASGDLFERYLHDMRIMQQYAALNRRAMADVLVEGMGLTVDAQFTSVHNYIDTEAMILRKGAVSAKADETLLIPINMRDGSLICTGKGNEDWNCSAPHGAGRLLSRSNAKSTFTLAQFESAMQGIYTTSVNRETLDESPMVYKSMEDIVDNIGDTVEVKEILRPIYNFKAGGDGA